MPDIPPLVTRKPTGKPPWPMILLAGAEKCGKSWSAAQFSASDLIDRTFYIELSEGAADEYGLIPGARYEIVEHDGSYRGIGYAIWAATKQPRENGKPHCIVIDSLTILWDMLSDGAQREANARWARKHNNRKPDEDVQVTMDLWNAAKKRWNDIIDLLRTYDGPVIVTARLERVAVVGAGGQPTAEKTLKVKAEKNLPYDVDVIVQIPAPREFQVTGLRSVRWQLKPGEARDVPEFSVDWLLRRMGLAEAGATAPRSYVAPRPDDPEPEQARQADPRTEAVAAPQRRPASEGHLVAPPKDEPDPWATAEPPEPMSIESQWIEISDLFKTELGVTNREEKVRRIGESLGRPITTTKQLTYAEADHVVSGLRTYRKGRVEREQLVADLQVGIEGAGSMTELNSVGEGMTEALMRKKISAADRAELLVLWGERAAVIQGVPAQGSAEMAGASA